MNDALQNRMAEVTRLMQQGQLAEATALIQQALGTAPPAVAVHPRRSDDAREPIESSARVVGDAPVATTTTTEDPPRSAGRAAAAAAPPHGTSTPIRIPGMPDGTHGIPGLSGTVRMRPRTTVPAPSAGTGEGRFLEASFTGPAGTRAYRLYIPRGYTGQAVPLLVMLHGCTQTPEDFAAGTRINLLAETHSFLVAYPAQAAAANTSRCWNWFEAAHQSRAQGEPSLIAGITQQVMATYNVDARRVYVAGLSAGGAMAAVLGVTYPDLYAAVGVHSGLAYAAAGDLASAMAAMQRGRPGPALPDTQAVAAPGVLPRSVPLILFHGERDTTVSPGNAEQLRAQWVATHGGGVAAETTEEVAGGQRTTRTIYRDAGGRSLVEQWRVAGLGHAWFGGSPHGSYTDTQGPDASAEMVRFFAEHPRT